MYVMHILSIEGTSVGQAVGMFSRGTSGVCHLLACLSAAACRRLSLITVGNKKHTVGRRLLTTPHHTPDFFTEHSNRPTTTDTTERNCIGDRPSHRRNEAYTGRVIALTLTRRLTRRCFVESEYLRPRGAIYRVAL